MNSRVSEGEQSISMVDSPVSIQAISRSEPSTPLGLGRWCCWSRIESAQGVLTKLYEQVRFARKRFDRYEVIDFLAVLFGYAISGERTLEAFYQHLQLFAVVFMALFDRDQLPTRSTLSRFFAALTEEPVEALRTLLVNTLRSEQVWPSNVAFALNLEHWDGCTWRNRSTPGVLICNVVNTLLAIR